MALVAVLAVPGTADALTVRMAAGGPELTGQVIVEDPVGAADSVTINHLPATISVAGPDASYRVSDPAGVTPAAPCKAVSAVEVSCPSYVGTVQVRLGAGDDHLTMMDTPTPEYVTGWTPDVDGGPGNDEITNGPGTVAAIIRGGAGNDLLLGNDGLSGDELRGGDGADLLVAGAGNDTCNGGLGNDRCNGGAGVDTFDGFHGNDRFYGGENHDWCQASLGRDVCVGGGGPDVCAGGAGRDRCVGGPGQDKLSGGFGRGDRCSGGPGRDIFFLSCERATGTEVEKRD